MVTPELPAILHCEFDKHFPRRTRACHTGKFRPKLDCFDEVLSGVRNAMPQEEASLISPARQNLFDHICNLLAGGNAIHATGQ